MLQWSFIFCSNRCSGEVILRPFDRMVQLCHPRRASSVKFDTPVDKAGMLLNRKWPLALLKVSASERLFSWKQFLAEGRFLLASCFNNRPRRGTLDTG